MYYQTKQTYIHTVKKKEDSELESYVSNSMNLMMGRYLCCKLDAQRHLFGLLYDVGDVHSFRGSVVQVIRHNHLEARCLRIHPSIITYIYRGKIEIINS